MNSRVSAPLTAMIAIITVQISNGDDFTSVQSPNFETSDHNVVVQGLKTYYVSKSSSQVIVDFGHKIVKYGSDIPHYAFQGFKPFLYDDQLFAIGGYGFWRVNPFLLEFDTLKGWQPSILGSLYEPVIDPSIYINGDTLVLFGGHTLDDDLINFKPSPFINYIDLKTRKCTKSINIDHLNYGSIIINQDNHVIFRDRNNFYYLNLKNPDLKRLLFDVKNIHTVENAVIDEVASEFISINNYKILFDDSNQSNNYLLISSAAGSLLLILLGYLIKRRKINTPSEQNSFNNSVDFNEIENDLINVLKDGPKYITELHGIFPVELSHSHKMKLVRETVNSINLKTKKSGGSLIHVAIDRTDSRRKRYFLSEEFN